ncbi:helix-turn-helix domain-containing protein [Paraburkholderia youngii]|uniref:Transposase n=1 Tax=Paraburkholderia youngii TaxID=2782701 RepID=A0A7W8LCA7_9BURK|nr:transposase [Paraburkholderia youngii]
MAKHDKRFKLKLIKTYLRGGIGLPVLAARHGIDYSMLRRWVDAYRLHGDAALCPKRSQYGVHFRLKVLRRMSRDGLSLREVTALYDIRDPARVSQWARLYDEGGIDALMPRRRGRPKKCPRPGLTCLLKRNLPMRDHAKNYSRSSCICARGWRTEKMYGPPRLCEQALSNEAVCVNVSGLSRVSRF